MGHQKYIFSYKKLLPPPIFCDVCRVEGGICGHPQSGGGGHEYRVVGIFDDFVGFFYIHRRGICFWGVITCDMLAWSTVLDFFSPIMGIGLRGAIY